MKRWSILRTRMEELFADSVKGRVGLRSTQYRNIHDREGRDWITLDGQELIDRPHVFYWCEWGANDPTEVQAHGEIPGPMLDYDARGEPGPLGVTLFDYLSMSIDEILGSSNVLIRALSMLDRRVGKRRLKNFPDAKTHPLIRMMHRFSCEAEGVALPQPPAVELADVRRPALPPRIGSVQRRRAEPYSWHLPWRTCPQ